MSRTPGLMSLDEMKKAMNEQAERVFPVFHKNSNFICFMDWGSYAYFMAITGKDFGTYMDENEPEWFKNNNITALKVERKSTDILNSVENENEDEVSKITVAIMVKMGKKQDQMEYYKKKYPRTFFNHLYPLDLV